MDGGNFAIAIRRLTETESRRGMVSIVFASVASLGLVGSDARKRKKRGKRKSPRPNAFGCLNVGQRCRGNGGSCCSGICTGKRPKRGKKDTSRCVAHNTGGCVVAEQSCGPSPDVPCGAGGFCLQTTGAAGFCGRIDQGACAACRRDVDCQSSFGDGSACVVCANGACPETGDRACVPAAA